VTGLPLIAGKGNPAMCSYQFYGNCSCPARFTVIVAGIITGNTKPGIYVFYLIFLTYNILFDMARRVVI
jgi:hypothetical protein